MGLLGAVQSLSDTQVPEGKAASNEGSISTTTNQHSKFFRGLMKYC
jgi:hypothetical protein